MPELLNILGIKSKAAGGSCDLVERIMAKLSQANTIGSRSGVKDMKVPLASVFRLLDNLRKKQTEGSEIEPAVKKQIIAALQNKIFFKETVVSVAG
eukprot:CAMPEP_0185591488 /NCGR_PEP_ID=MMETSP0434-20130131/64705_1 /TAXON_ID=626734 ORGANISM="Favella taraikaensis, Strain Fe Narragansett Bay" /NCGR_SAMPLE_ID=MMETSP0434 /ASSEMBLY_ACC=CAM_ASM_000379 /LENGTH=95 /DNA_ID=CAMNT_0028216535 /DNA_START=305 /DNA_END=592 /DNA_ORIENTATION=-